MTGKHYLLCTTPRTGSSLLCSLLASTAVAGMRHAPIIGHEYLLELVGPASQGIDWEALDLAEWLRGAFRRTRSPNGVAGFKLMWEEVKRVARAMEQTTRYSGVAPFGLPRFLPEDTKYLWLIRRDRVRQAVSLTKAIQTQCWDAPAQDRFTGFCVFDYVGTERRLRMLETHHQRWREFFARNRIEPLEIVYEDLVSDRDGTVRRVLDYLEVSTTTLPAHDDYFERQSDAVNESWVREFHRVRSSGPLKRRLYGLQAYPRWLAAKAIGASRGRRRARQAVADYGPV